MTKYFGVLAFLLSFSIAHAADPPSVRVYLVEPVAEQFIDDALKGRIDSTRDLRDKLEGKNKVLRLVKTRDEAQVVIEVLGRNISTASSSTISRNAWGTVGSEANIVLNLGVRLSVGTYETEITGVSEQNQFNAIPTWHAAANIAAIKIERWLKENRNKLEK